MCGRYAAAKDPDALVEEFEVEESVVEKPLAPDFNVAPTKEVYAVIDRASDDNGVTHRQLRTLRWGLVPSWAKDRAIGSRLINARAETLAEKPAFRRAFTKRRCLLPADGYFEWYASEHPDAPTTSRGKPLKQPFFIHRTDGRSLAMAGLYEWWRDDSRADDDPHAWLLSATIITTEAADAVGRIHSRMPVVIDDTDWQAWLDPKLSDREQIEGLMHPALDDTLAAYPVSTRVNSVRNNGPELIEPLPLDDAVPGSVGDDGFWPPSPDS